MDNNEIQENQEHIQVPLEKAKKPRSEKQLEHFKNMALKRKENIEKKKLEKKIEASKLLLEHEIITPAPIITNKKQKKELSPLPSEEEEESDESAEKIIVNVKNKKKKKKAKEIIIYNDDSESEEEEGGYEIIEPKRALKTQQNKKTKIYNQPQPQIYTSKINNNDLFC